LSWASQPGTVDNSRIIARNSFWYGLELFLGLVGGFFTSVIVARVIGPERLGYFNLILWMTNVTAMLAVLGIPGTIRKYMAEYLSKGEPGIAHAIYNTALRFQITFAASVTGLAITLVWIWGHPGYRLISILLVMSMAPRMIGFVPSQANTAAEDMRRNTIPSLLGALFNVVFTLFSLWIGWGLAGVAIGYAGGAVLDTALKLYGISETLGPIPPAKISPELKKRMYAYSGQGIALMLLNLVVWDKSDVFVLNLMNRDIKQVTFFTTAFNITERLLTFPNSFANSLNATMLAQFGRGEEKLRNLAVSGAKYAFLIAVPLMVGVACVTRPAVLLLYGEPYRPLVPVLAIAAVLGISKAMMAPASALLQATENQGVLIWVGCICGALDIALDFLWTPAYGAIGAAWANGLAQTAAAIIIWWRVWRQFRIDLRLAGFARIALSGAAMAALVVGVGYLIPGRFGLVVAVLSGVLGWCLMLRLTGAINRADRDRFANLSRTFPPAIRPVFTTALDWLAAHPKKADALTSGATSES
jgi:O-antigen/teichoic acid export membrane protein